MVDNAVDLRLHHLTLFCSGCQQRVSAVWHKPQALLSALLGMTLREFLVYAESLLFKKNQ